MRSLVVDDERSNSSGFLGYRQPFRWWSIHASSDNGRYSPRFLLILFAKV